MAQVVGDGVVAEGPCAAVVGEVAPRDGGRGGGEIADGEAVGRGVGAVACFDTEDKAFGSGLVGNGLEEDGGIAGDGSL